MSQSMISLLEGGAVSLVDIHNYDTNTVLNLIDAIWLTRVRDIKTSILNHLVKAGNEKMYVIEYNHKPVGITGYYTYDEKSVGLCWHGVRRDMRGIGITDKSLEMIKNLALETIEHHHAKRFIELIPEDRSELIPYFENKRFYATGEVSNLDWLPKSTQWFVYAQDLT